MQSSIQQGLLFYIILIGSLSFHEWGHAFVADKCGDSLPRRQGRVTLNPLAHIDPIGTVLIPLMMIFLPIFTGTLPFAVVGWGKPVQVSVFHLRGRALLIAIAGPSMNLFVALIAAIIGGICIRYNPALGSFFVYVILLNCLLFTFNMIPIPPLDGSHFLRYFFKMKAETYAALGRLGFFFLLILINTPFFGFLYSGAVFLGSFFHFIMWRVGA